eukprot:TRINITY_DN2464_c0_g1_i1.p1 TRINITY_DN2464_c0_g1~~TRINITY_DN2464_c0_g1_i1.p1  ORF type:complete len:556 (-),score=123.08 TRINITY_DN2464_c0_g1_i1:136-1803(-)
MEMNVEEDSILLQDKIEINKIEISSPFYHTFEMNLPISNIFNYKEIGELYVSTRSGRISSLKGIKADNKNGISRGKSFIHNEIEERSFKCGKKVYCLWIWEKSLYIGTYNGEIEKLTLNGELISSIKGHKNRVYDLKVFNGLLYSCSKDAVICCWDRNLRLVQRMEENKKSVRCLELLERDVFICAGKERRVYVYNISQDFSHKLIHTLPQHHKCSILCIINYKRYFLTGSRDGLVIWDKKTYTALRKFGAEKIEYPIESMIVVGDYVFTSSRKSKVVMFKNLDQCVKDVSKNTKLEIDFFINCEGSSKICLWGNFICVPMSHSIFYYHIESILNKNKSNTKFYSSKLFIDQISPPFNLKNLDKKFFLDPHIQSQMGFNNRHSLMLNNYDGHNSPPQDILAQNDFKNLDSFCKNLKEVRSLFEQSFTNQNEYVIEDWLDPKARPIIQKNKIMDFENFGVMKKLDQETQRNLKLKKLINRTVEDYKKQESVLEKNVQLGLCIVCKVNKRSVLLMPCSHFVCCNQCIQEIFKNSEGNSCCPKCNVTITVILSCKTSL